MQHLLTLLIFLPVFAALVLLVVSAARKNVFRIAALGVALTQTLLLVPIVQQYLNETTTYRLTEQYAWITLDLGQWGVVRSQYFVALDGLSLPLVCMSVMVMLIATLSSWKIGKNEKGYFVLLLILNAAVLGSFCALDFLLFYVFFEFMLLPMYFLIGIWGGPRREYASIKFFLYTLLGSIFILITMIGLYLSVQEPFLEGTARTFSIPAMQDVQHFIANSVLDPASLSGIGAFTFREWAFILLFAGFAIKLPAVPFHTWLPDAHVEAPTPISIVLAAILLKVGAYGLARIAWPVFPEAVVHFSSVIAGIGVLSIIYGALNAMASKDLKRLIAYSSVSHMGFVLLGLASGTTEGISGAAYQLVSHGFISAMLFAIAGVLYDRTHDRTIQNYSGLSGRMPVYFSFVLIGFFASLGLPGFSGFIAEVLVFLGAFNSSANNALVPVWLAVIATGGLILGAAYYLWTIQRMFFGPFDVKVAGASLHDTTKLEVAVLLPLAIIIFALGVLPQPLIELINTWASPLAETMTNLVTPLKQ